MANTGGMTTTFARAPITRPRARAIATFSLDAVTPAVLHEAKRSLFNVLAVAIGAARNPGVDTILRVARECAGVPTAPIVGRSERTDALYAALANGFAGHVDDYDDTHLQTVIHPAAAIAATLLALAPTAKPTGAAAMRAFILGCEVQLRLGVAISPEHYDEGWHITGTCGTIGAAVCAAALLGADEDAVVRTLGIAASSTVGQREAFGRMTKAYHAGKAAFNGIRAALLALRGFGAPPDAIEGPGGFADSLATSHRIQSLPFDLETGLELAKNTYKPYPCGIVAHPSIDAASALFEQVSSVDDIVSVRVRCHPLVPELMGNLHPADGLQARFSAVHGVTMGLMTGRVGLAQYEDEVVNAPEVIALRARISLNPDPAVGRDESFIQVTLRDGRTIEEHVEHARGSLERPLTDRELYAKAEALIEPILPGRTDRVRQAVSDLIDAPSVDALLAAVAE